MFIRSWRSLEYTGKAHVLVSKQLKNNKLRSVSQQALVHAQFGFIGFIVAKPEKLGVEMSPYCWEAFVHFWRVVGYMLGIEDEYNLCSGSYHATKMRSELILDKMYRPLLDANMDDHTTIVRSLVDGLSFFDPTLDCEAAIYFTKWMAGCKNYVYYESDPHATDVNLNDSRKIIQSLNWYSRFMLYVYFNTFTYLNNFFVFRWLMNVLISLALFINCWFPFTAIYRFGMKKSYIGILKGTKKTKATL